MRLLKGFRPHRLFIGTLDYQPSSGKDIRGLAPKNLTGSFVVVSS
jgi:hypothetical protein